METVSLGKGGPLVSRVGLGMWQAGGKAWGDDVNDKDCLAAMRRAVKAGITLIDTAEVYGKGHSEEVVGQFLKEAKGKEVVVATKVSGGHSRFDDVLRACDGSLKRLGRKSIDVYQVHWPDPWDQVPLKETMRALEALQKDGKVNHIAVSNFAVRDLEVARSHLSHANIVSNQVHYSMLHREVEEEVVPYCKKEGIGVLAWSPLEKGVLTGKYTAANRPKDPIRVESDYFKEDNLRAVQPLLQLLARIGEAHGRTMTQVALNWLMRQDHVVPIPGAKRAAQVDELAGAADWKLTAKELREIDGALRALRLDTF